MRREDCSVRERRPGRLVAGSTELRWPAAPSYRRVASHGAWVVACGGPTSTYVLEITTAHMMSAWASLCEEFEGPWVLRFPAEGTPEVSSCFHHLILGRSRRAMVLCLTSLLRIALLRGVACNSQYQWFASFVEFPSAREGPSASSRLP